jgi:hypothetical protein
MSGRMQSTNPAKPTEEKKQQRRQREGLFYAKAPVAIAGLLGGVYALFILVRFKEDTTPITNVAFAFTATLAALSFSFARVIETDALRDRVMYAGERLLHGALLFLVASILRYFVFLFYKIPSFPGLTIIEFVLSLAFGLIGGSIFFLGVIFAHAGLRILNDLLLSRVNRHKDWNHLW